MRVSQSIVRAGALLALVSVVAVAMATAGSAASEQALDKKEKKQGDKRWLNVGEGFTTAEANDRFLQQTKVIIVDATAGPSTAGNTFVPCPAGNEALGGGYSFLTSDVPPEVQVEASSPLFDLETVTGGNEGTNPAANGWTVRVDNSDTISYDYSVGVICSPAA